MIGCYFHALGLDDKDFEIYSARLVLFGLCEFSIGRYFGGVSSLSLLLVMKNVSDPFFRFSEWI